ncbi:hypothetical protein DH2020_022952 [Rehmannia glutinosa]|uniref:DUF1421 domain-containing protein n=1 Tax=Rehmannia glutinosa TaxID=99300 RepID=A0ABR0W8E8_REHGL
MASGSSVRSTNSGSKTFDFGSDDILCSYEDYGTQDANNGTHSDPSFAANSAKVVSFPAATYSPPEEASFNEDVVSTVENTMKKYTDNLTRFLEGISSRLSQLELYCYNLDKSIGEMRSDLGRDHGESESKLKSLEKHVQEVHRSLQILRDKQELADTQKELAKLQLAQKESSPANNIQQNEDRASTPASEAKKSDSSSDQQLALALPHQVAPQPSLPARPAEHQQQTPMAPPSSMPSQVPAYYLPPPQTSNMTASQTQQYLPTQQTQVQDHPRMAPPQPHSYPQQWNQQLPIQPPQHHIRNSSSQMVYSNYQSPSEMAPNNSMPMQQVQYVGPSQPGSAGRPVQQQQHLKTTTGYGAQAVDRFVPTGPPPPGNAYMVLMVGGDGLQSGDHVVGIIQRLEESGQPIDFNSVLDRLNRGHSSAGSQRGWSS